MAKRGLKLSVRIPNFIKDPIEWRRKIHAAIIDVQKQGTPPVKYLVSDKLDVQIRLHLRGRKLSILDLDNRAKDILDALQGMIGEKGKSRELAAIIPDDSQMYRLIVEKRLAPKADKEALSTIVIRRYDGHGGTARAPREFRKHVP